MRVWLGVLTVEVLQIRGASLNRTLEEIILFGCLMPLSNLMGLVWYYHSQLLPRERGKMHCVLRFE
jgi:hypothetical protein